MNLGNLYTDIAFSLGRGSSLDAMIPIWVDEAQRNCEVGYTFMWMEKLGELTLDPSAEVPNRADIPNARVKAIDWLQPILSSVGDPNEVYGEPLDNITSNHVTSLHGGAPGAWWQEGFDKVWFDAIPDASVRYRMAYSEYTSWSQAGSAEPALLVRGYSTLKYETLAVAAVALRDPRIIEAYSAARLEAWNKLIGADQEARNKPLRRLSVGKHSTGYR